jgi:hypothetical protein
MGIVSVHLLLSVAGLYSLTESGLVNWSCAYGGTVVTASPLDANGGRIGNRSQAQSAEPAGEVQPVSLAAKTVKAGDDRPTRVDIPTRIFLDLSMLW